MTVTTDTIVDVATVRALEATNHWDRMNRTDPALAQFSDNDRDLLMLVTAEHQLRLVRSLLAMRMSGTPAKEAAAKHLLATATDIADGVDIKWASPVPFGSPADGEPVTEELRP